MSKQTHMSRTRFNKVRSLLKSGRLEDAAKVCEKLCTGKQTDPGAFFLLADIYTQKGRLQEAINCIDRVIKFSPDNAEAYAKKADTLRGVNLLEQAVNNYKKAVDYQPDEPKLLTNYAAVLMGMLRYSEAEPLLRKAIDLDPALSQPYSNLGSCLNSQGKTADAIRCYEQALQKANDDALLHSNYLLTRHYLPDQDAPANLQAHIEWARRYVNQESGRAQQGDYSPDPKRKIRIGYVSPDFRTHSVAYFILPLLKNHKTDDFDIYCYSDVRNHDNMTRLLKSQQCHWRDTAGLSDLEFVRYIRNDRVDVLVDLAGHTAGNRLKVFAAKPAPVQVTWLGYPDTTGLSAIDYRLSDIYADPIGAEQFCVEKIIRLEDCFLCYEPIANAPPEARAPCEDAGFITFGSFNNLAKINRDVVKCWAEILQQCSTAKLYIKNPGLTDATVQEAMKARFGDYGIESDRLTLKGVSRTTTEHLSEYRQIDIALDTFPYNGTTTTCEAIHMGVPVLTLTGDGHANRVGSSLLTALTMPDWITTTPEDYVVQAVARAKDTDTIINLRAVLRRKLTNSVLCDSKLFTGRFENMYRTIWQNHCNKGVPR